MFRKISHSLVGRITAFAGMLVLIAVGVSSVALLWAYEINLQQSANHRLTEYSDLLVISLVYKNDKLTLYPQQALATMPRYWQIDADGKHLFKSARLKQWIEPKPENLFTYQRLQAPNGVGGMIEAIQNTLLLSDKHVTFISGLDKPVFDAYVTKERKQLVAPLYWILTLESLLLILVSYALIRYCISPIKAVNSAMQKIRQGKEERIEGDYPTEIKELSDEINHLLDYTSGTITKHREFSSNLAHSLKTPMTVIRNESDIHVIKEKVDGMLGIIERNLARVHSAPSSNILSAHAKVLPVIEDIADGFGKVYGKTIEIDCPTGLIFRGDKADLFEILGNIIENACKFAQSRIRISGTDEAIIVEDDGEGIPASQRNEVLARGTRLDTTKPGTGIGLAIANDIVGLYKGHIALETSAMSGLKLIIHLPLQR